MPHALSAQVLSYHVIPAGALNSKQLQNQAYITALQGESLAIKKRSSGSVRITAAANLYYIPGAPCYRANVIVPDIRAGNSIIHVIDAVLVPPSYRGCCGAQTHM